MKKLIFVFAVFALSNISFAQEQDIASVTLACVTDALGVGSNSADQVIDLGAQNPDVNPFSQGQWLQVSEDVRSCVENQGYRADDMTLVMSVLSGERRVLTVREMAHIFSSLVSVK